MQGSIFTECLWIQILLVPIKVSFVLWTVALGKILTTDNIGKQQLVVLDWPCMCKKDGETIWLSHSSLPYCLGVVGFGHFIVWGSVGLYWEVLWSSWHVGKASFADVVMWNTRTWEGCEKSIHHLKLLFLNTLFEWVNSSGLFYFDSFPDMLDRCSFCL